VAWPSGRKRTFSATQKDLWCAVPKRDNFVRVLAEGHGERSSKAEVRQLQVILAIQKKVLGLEVPVLHPMLVAESDAIYDLLQIMFHQSRFHEAPLLHQGVHILMQVLVEVLEYQGQSVILVQHVEEIHDI
jgi:hypothetical protein